MSSFASTITRIITHMCRGHKGSAMNLWDGQFSINRSFDRRIVGVQQESISAYLRIGSYLAVTTCHVCCTASVMSQRPPDPRGMMPPPLNRTEWSGSSSACQHEASGSRTDALGHSRQLYGRITWLKRGLLQHSLWCDLPRLQKKKRRKKIVNNYMLSPFVLMPKIR